MKAVRIVKPNDLRVVDEPKPVLDAENNVIIRMTSAGICGSDVPRVLYNGVHFYPIVLGHEFSGVVDEIGEGVTTLKPGDRVAGMPLVPCMKCPDCQKKIYVFGESKIDEIAAEKGLKVLGRIPMKQAVAQKCDNGLIEDCKGKHIAGIGELLDEMAK